MTTESDSRLGEDLANRTVRQSGLLAVLVTIVCVVVAVTHWPALSAKAFSFDDDQYLTKNLLVQNPGWHSAGRFLAEILEPSTVGGYYQPLAMISLMFDYALGGRENNLMPFHRTSLILHIANTALIIILLYLLFAQTPNSSGSWRIWIAAGVGLLFGIHPMTVEPIPWIGERKTLLAAFFSLLSLVFYVLYSHKNKKRFYFACLAAYTLALLSKPTSTPLPAVMLLMDYWPLKRLNWRAIWEKLPFFVFGIISSIITVISQARTGGTTMPSQISPERIPLVLCHNIIFYLYKMVWPVNLSSHYPFPEPLNLSQPMVLAGVIGTAILILLLLVSLRWTRTALTGWLMFFVAILPTMQIIGFSNVIASDKFAYLPSIGLLMILAAFLVWLCGIRFSIFSRAAAVVILLLACAEASATRRYLVYWQDTVKFFQYMSALAPDAVPLHNNLGMTLYSRGMVNDAVSHYRRALQLQPDDPKTHNNLGNALRAQGKFEEAIEHYTQAIKYKQDFAEAHNNLGISLVAQGRIEEGINHYRQALQLKPDSFEIQGNLALVLATCDEHKFRNPDEAIKLAESASRLTGYRNATILNTLAAAYAYAGRFNEAVTAAQAALDAAIVEKNDKLTNHIRGRLEQYKRAIPQK